jgi:hypothetical protein
MKNLIKSSRFWTGIIVFIIIITIITQSKKINTLKPGENQSNINNQTSEQQEPVKTTISTPNVWEGMLKISDNETQGNLMLLTADKKIYIKTSRDFSDLLDKKVSVTYEGTTDEFLLGTITESNQ